MREFVGQKERVVFADGAQHVPYQVLSLRPISNEWMIPKERGWQDRLELIEHGLLEDNPALIDEVLHHLPPYADFSKKKLLEPLQRFLQKDWRGGGDEAVVKCKLLLGVRKALVEQGNLAPNEKAEIDQKLLRLAQTYFVAGRRIATTLRLTQEEKMQLGRIVQKKDPKYYETHIKVHFLEEKEKVSAPDRLETMWREWKKQAVQKSRPKIAALEKKLQVTEKATEEDLQYTIPLKKEGEREFIVCHPEEIASFFTTEERLFPKIQMDEQGDGSEKAAVRELQRQIDAFSEKKEIRHSLQADETTCRAFIQEKLVPKKEKAEKACQKMAKEIEELLLHGEKPEEKLALYANRERIATFEELRLALHENTLSELQTKKKLPKDADLNKLQTLVENYFQSWIEQNALVSSIKNWENLLQVPKEAPERKEMGRALYHLLTTQRRYDPKVNPMLLTFEAQQFLLFKPLEGGMNQLDLMEALGKDPHGIVLAPTGAGKTSVLSVMRSLLKANGKNLVVQKVLPHLYDQTHDQMKDVLGGLYDRALFPLRFTLQMPLKEKEWRTVDGKKVPCDTSVFKTMYQRMLETMESKGIIVTDYKSLPIIEMKFWKLAQDMLEKKERGEEISPLEQEHFVYLRKILQLVQNRADENMDEFDVPNRPINKTLLDLGIGGAKLPAHLVDMGLRLYQALHEHPQLRIDKNLQKEIPESTRKTAIEEVAAGFAKNLAKLPVTSERLLAYFLGKSDEVLNDLETTYDLEAQDTLAFLKDEFSTYLSITLGKKAGSDYASSHDGKRTIPCHGGEPHDAKPGTLLEQINYTIQDYLQRGITFYDLHLWFTPLQIAWQDAKSEQQKNNLLQQLHAVFPKHDFLSLEQALEEGREDLVKEINEDQEAFSRKKIFIEKKLEQLQGEGSVIPIDPQNAVDMSRAVSAISATSADKETYHSSFCVNQEIYDQVTASMVYRLLDRANQMDVVSYDPEHPEELFKKGSYTACIDGAGAFSSGELGAKNLLQTNPSLKQVRYHKEGHIVATGEEGFALDSSGFFFDEGHTRGTDVPLDVQAHAILTSGGKEGLRGFMQKEGRLRQATQKYTLAVNTFQEEIKTVVDQITKSVKNDGAVDAKDIFRKEKQRIAAALRKDARHRLLQEESIDSFLLLFGKAGIRELFIQLPGASFDQSGKYFQKNKKIHEKIYTPKEALEKYKEEQKSRAKNLGLTNAVDWLDKIVYNELLYQKLGETKVSSIGSEEELGMEQEIETETEQEQEIEAEQEIALELETEEEKVRHPEAIQYPLRREDSGIVHSLASETEKPYDSRILFTDEFLPLSRRGKKALMQRALFDGKMYRVGRIAFLVDERWRSNELLIRRVKIYDPLLSTPGINEFVYDIRTRTFLSFGSKEKAMKGEQSSFQRKERVLRKNPEFIKLVAQIKFFDGHLYEYTKEEKEALCKWFSENDAKALRNHLFTEILRYRSSDRKAFPGSELDQLFSEVGVN